MPKLLKRGIKNRKRLARKARKHDKNEKRLGRRLAGAPCHTGTVVSRVGNKVVRHSPELTEAIRNMPRDPGVPVGGVIHTASPEEVQEIMDLPTNYVHKGKPHFTKDGKTYRVEFGEGYTRGGWVRKQPNGLWQASETGETWFGEYKTRGSAAESLR